MLEWNHFRESIHDDKVIGIISIYASITAVYSLLPNLLEVYRSAHPDVQLKLRTGAAERAVEQVLSGEIDLAVAALPDQKMTRLEFMPLAETPLIFIAPKNTKRSDQPLDLSKVPLVVPQSGVARHRLDLWLKHHDIAPNISTEVSGNEALIAMVRLGAGIGIVPQLALDRSPLRKEVRIVDQAPRLDPYVVGLCSSKRNLRRPAVLAMWQLAKESLA